MVEVVARFWLHAQLYYRRPNGTPRSAVENFRQALKPLKELYGSTKAIEFGPRALKTVRQKMIDRGSCRTNVNRQISRIKSVFKWATAEELIPPSVHRGLQSVVGLKRGRTATHESEPIKPVPDAHIVAVRPHVARQVWVLVQLQLLTGARGGELVEMRSIDLDTSGSIWLYRRVDHKTAHHGRERVIYLGPRVQAIVRELMVDRLVDAYLFSPLDAERERHAKARTHRHQPVEPPRTSRTVGDQLYPFELQAGHLWFWGLLFD